MREDLDKLLLEIINHPNDDSLRLVYADCLDDNGEYQRAEYIRLSMEACHAKKDVAASFLKKAMGILYGGQDRLEGAQGHVIVTTNSTAWTKSLWGATDAAVLWERGFVYYVACTWRTFTNRAPQLFREHPITLVDISDITFHRSGQGTVEERHSWRLPQYSWIDTQPMLYYSDTPEPCKADARLFAWAYGRRAAGLVP